MSLLDDARRLAETEPTYAYSYYGSECLDCLHCGGSESRKEGAGPHGLSLYVFDHEPTCPWLSMSKIVEALARLEALEK